MNGTVQSVVIMVAMVTIFLWLLWFLLETRRPAEITSYHGFTVADPVRYGGNYMYRFL